MLSVINKLGDGQFTIHGVNPVQIEVLQLFSLNRAILTSLRLPGSIVPKLTKSRHQVAKMLK